MGERFCGSRPLFAGPPFSGHKSGRLYESHKPVAAPVNGLAGQAAEVKAELSRQIVICREGEITERKSQGECMGA